MKPVAVIGGGIAGMSAALYLSKAGHPVTVFEKDSAVPPAVAADAFSWERRGAPQMCHSHAMLARMRNLFRDDHPEVLQALLSVGAREMRIYEDMPVPDGGSGITEEDRDIVLLACRRATLEWVMRATLAKLENVEFRSGVGVKALLCDDGGSVQGLLLDGNEEFTTDIVVAADGRRSSVPKWLAALGITLDEDTEEPAGIVYFSRFFKLDEGKDFPTTGLVANDLGYLFYAAFCGDSRYYSIALSANDDDEVLRYALADPEKYEKAAREIPELQAWLSCGSPVTDVFPMGSLINRRRHFVRDGQSLVPGLHVIGDAHVCTNPAYGRGLSMAIWQAKLVSEAIAAHPGDASRQCLAFQQALEAHIYPWFDIAVMMDGARTAERQRLAATDDPHAAVDNPMKALADAANADPEVWRTFWRAMNLLAPPSSLMSEAFIEKVVTVAAALPAPDPATIQELPARDDMLSALDLSDVT